MNGKLCAVIEIVIFLLFLVVIMVIMDLMVAPIYTPWLKKTFMILLSLFVILIRGEPRKYGLIPRNARLSSKWIGILILVFILPMIPVLAIWGRNINSLDLLVSFVWFMIFVGFAEELAFRGYIQSGLNECFTKTYKSFIGYKVEWHEGTLITGALIFGPIHLLNAINFRTGEINISIGLIIIVIAASFVGILFGIIREVSGDVFVCSVLHGIIDFVGVELSGKIVGVAMYWAPMAISFFVFFAFLFERLINDFSSGA